MSLPVALSFVPQYAVLPSWFRRSMVGISTRFPYDGASAAYPASGVTGLAGTMTPMRSVNEALAWGAESIWWTYSELASTRGFASTAAYHNEFKSAGIQYVQAATNTSSPSISLGPFAKDLAGTDWSANSRPPRPALSSGSYPVGQEYQRIQISVTMMRLSDQAGTIAPKLATVATALAAGATGIQLDDPRGPVGSAGFRGAVPYYDLTTQGCDFSGTAVAAFPAWLAANTTSAERTALGLPADPTGLDIVAWTRTNLPTLVNNGTQVDANAIDQYRWRTSISTNTVAREVFLGLYNRYQRAAAEDFSAQLRASMGSAPLSANFWQAQPGEMVSGIFRKGLYSHAIAETAPPYWDQLSPYAVDSSGWYDARATQCARQRMNSATYDLCGLLALVEHKPTSPTAAPPRVLKQILRQSNLQSIGEGVIPLPPIDVFMTTNDTDTLGNPRQGVNVDGYRFWASVADYGDIWTFLRAQAGVIDGYEKLVSVHCAAHNGTFPFQDGGPAVRYAAVMSRLAELWKRDVDYHWLTVGEPGGMLPQEPSPTVLAAAPIIIRVQDDSDYYTQLPKLIGPTARGWSTAAADAAMAYSPVRSMSPYIRATARYNASAGRASVHLINMRTDASGVPMQQTTLLRWNPAFGRPSGAATVTRLGEAPSSVDMSPGYAWVTLREYAIVNFAVAP